jgi:hypothetical protein
VVVAVVTAADPATPAGRPGRAGPAVAHEEAPAGDERDADAAGQRGRQQLAVEVEVGPQQHPGARPPDGARPVRVQPAQRLGPSRGDEVHTGRRRGRQPLEHPRRVVDRLGVVDEHEGGPDDRAEVGHRDRLDPSQRGQRRPRAGDGDDAGAAVEGGTGERGQRRRAAGTRWPGDEDVVAVPQRERGRAEVVVADAEHQRPRARPEAHARDPVDGGGQLADRRRGGRRGLPALGTVVDGRRPPAGWGAGVGDQPGHDVDEPAGDQRRRPPGDAGRPGIQRVGQAVDPALAHERGQRRRQRAGAGCGENHVDADLGTVGEHALERVEDVEPGGVVELGEEAGDAVDEHDDRRVVDGSGRGSAAVELAAQAADEADLALALGGTDHRAGVR